MNRARAAWIAAGVVVLAALGYLVLRRRGGQAALPVSAAPAPLRVAAAPPPGPPAVEVEETEPWPPDEQSAAPAAVDEPVQAAEKPLAAWARVAIVVVALLAFFAVSLLAKKGV